MTTYKLSHNKVNGTYKLTVPPEIVKLQGWGKGQPLYFRRIENTLSFYANKQTFGIKMKLQLNNVFSIAVPARVVEHLGFKSGQQFKFSSSDGFISYSPYMGNKLLGVAEKRKTVNNLPKRQIGVNEDESLQCV